GQLLGDEHAESMRIVETRARIFPAIGAGRILWKCNGGARQSGAEDFAYIVKGLGVRVSDAHGHLLEQVVSAVFKLCGTVIGKARVRALAEDARAAIHATNVCSRSWTN